MTALDQFKQRMFARARLERTVVQAAINLVDQWESTDPWGKFGEVEDALIIAVRDYQAGAR